MDMTITDNGVGMDWELLTKGFFSYFESGKEQEESATGGYGIAKSIIQQTPEHGWSIETQGHHTSRWGRDMFYAEPYIENYIPIL